MKLWVSRPFYELLPYYNVVVGGVMLATGMLIGEWRWALVCSLAGVVSMSAGLVICIKRRRSRNSSEY